MTEQEQAAYILDVVPSVRRRIRCPKRLVDELEAVVLSEVTKALLSRLRRTDTPRKNWVACDALRAVLNWLHMELHRPERPLGSSRRIDDGSDDEVLRMRPACNRFDRMRGVTHHGGPLRKRRVGFAVDLDLRCYRTRQRVMRAAETAAAVA